MQVPMVPLTDIIRRLAGEMFGLKVADAGAVLGTPEDIVALCTAAGFKGIQVVFFTCAYLTTVGSCQGGLADF